MERARERAVERMLVLAIMLKVWVWYRRVVSARRKGEGIIEVQREGEATGMRLEWRLTTRTEEKETEQRIESASSSFLVVAEILLGERALDQIKGG